MAFSRLTGRSPRTVRRWVSTALSRGSEAPPEIAMLVTRLHPHDADVVRAREPSDTWQRGPQRVAS